MQLVVALLFALFSFTILSSHSPDTEDGIITIVPRVVSRPVALSGPRVGRSEAVLVVTSLHVLSPRIISKVESLGESSPISIVSSVSELVSRLHLKDYKASVARVVQAGVAPSPVQERNYCGECVGVCCYALMYCKAYLCQSCTCRCRTACSYECRDRCQGLWFPYDRYCFGNCFDDPSLATERGRCIGKVLCCPCHCVAGVTLSVAGCPCITFLCVKARTCPTKDDGCGFMCC